MNKISFSQLSVFNTCKKKFEYEYIEKLQPRSFSSALNTGSLFHKGMEILYKTGSLEEALKIVEIEASKIDTSSFTQDDYNSYEKDTVMVHGMLQGAFDIFYQRDLEKNVKILEVESEYIIDVNSDYKYHLILDLLLEIDGKITLVEYKTASRLGDTYFNRLKIDLQTRTMATVLNKYKDREIERIVFRIIKKPSIRIKNSETMNDYLERLNMEFMDKPTDYFIEQEFMFTKEDLMETQKQLEKNMQQYDFATNNNCYPKNTSICSFINCPFIHLCISPKNIDLYREKEDRKEEENEEHN